MMATIAQCKKCVHREDCPILLMLRHKDVKGDGILRKKCISYKDKK